VKSGFQSISFYVRNQQKSHELMNPSEKPGVGSGFLGSAFLTLATLSIFYLAWIGAGLPFVPFDLFDWVTRHLPGKVIQSGIDVMVSTIRALKLGPTASSAKLAEQASAILGACFTGAIVGTICFLILRGLRGRFVYVVGAIAGLIFAIPVMLISQNVKTTATVPPVIGSIWILLAFIGWGTALGWTCLRLSRVVTPDASSEAASVRQIDRRRFLLRLGGASAAITVVGAVVALESGERKKRLVTTAGNWSSSHALPNADAAVKPVRGTRAEYTPLDQHYRIDINTSPPVINEAQWRLKVSGLVEKPLAFTLDELRRLEPLSQFVTLACISNPVGGDLIGTTRWTGVSFQRLLPLLGLKPNASHFKIHAADGFYEIVSLETIKGDERVMLTYEWDGVPLLRDHGFPLRIYIPNVYGMKQPKWIVAIEAIDQWEPGYWVTRGWDKVAEMKATSVIDTIDVNMMIVEANRQTLVPIGGIAHAGARGISKVEVQVDDGPWEEAKLRQPLSRTTWVIWRYEWQFQHGQHVFVVRCFDGAGQPQIVQRAPPEPSGASGLFSKSEML
jgi:DMSO/TMAO reductase YedYZ molybdopterin-dependent catalytic subunit